MSKKIIVTGGAGYIGSHTVVDLMQKGYEVISLDDFSNAKRSVYGRMEKIVGQAIINVEVDLCNLADLNAVVKKLGQVDGIIHFAAFKAVGESVENPLKYFHNNLTGLTNVLQMCEDYHIPNFIFSSSCTVYGQPDALPVSEATPLKDAASPYGLTKQLGEEMIASYAENKGLNYALLRYFNPAGAHHSGWIGEESKRPALNLVPIITETAIGKRGMMYVHGDNYDTRDGTCIRDYIHVEDLANGHTQALEYLSAHDEPAYRIFNFGIGAGVTVLEAIQAFERVTDKAVNYQMAARRPGDVAAIYADYARAAEVLKWNPKFDIEAIMSTAWLWENNKVKFNEKQDSV